MKFNSNLQILSLNSNRIGSEGSFNLSKGIANAINLKSLYLGLNSIECNSIEDLGLKYISNALKRNASIELIDLSSNFITQEGTNYLSEALHDTKSLFELLLCKIKKAHNLFGDNGLVSLKLIENHSLKSVYLSLE